MPKTTAQSNLDWIRLQNRKALEALRQDGTATAADYARALERADAIEHDVERRERADRIARARESDDLRRIVGLASDLRAAAIEQASKLVGNKGPGQLMDPSIGARVLGEFVEQMDIADRTDAAVVRLAANRARR